MKMSVSAALPSSVRSVSARLAVGEGLAGLVRSMIWTPLSDWAVTAA